MNQNTEQKLYEIHKSLEKVKIQIKENRRKYHNKEQMEQLFLKKQEEAKQENKDISLNSKEGSTKEDKMKSIEEIDDVDMTDEEEERAKKEEAKLTKILQEQQ